MDCPTCNESYEDGVEFKHYDGLGLVKACSIVCLVDELVNRGWYKPECVCGDPLTCINCDGYDCDECREKDKRIEELEDS